MVRGRGDSIGSFRNHPGTGDIPDNFCAGQVAADTGFCTLPHLDLNGCPCLQIVGIDAKTAGSHLHDGILPIAVKIFMQTAFAGVIENPQFRGCQCERLMCVVADGAIAHGRKHDRHRQFQLRRQ